MNRRVTIVSLLGLAFVATGLMTHDSAVGQTGPAVGPGISATAPRSPLDSTGNLLGIVSSSAQEAVGQSDPLHSALDRYLVAKDEGSRGLAREDLVSALGKLFDEQQAQRQEQIKEIEVQLEQLRDKLKKRAAARQQLIEHRLTGLIQDAEGLGWGGDASPPRGLIDSFFQNGFPPGGMSGRRSMMGPGRNPPVNYTTPSAR